MTGCQCTEAGICPRHGVYKPLPWVEMCQRSQRYFEAWEAGVGPGQNIPPPEVEVSRCAGPRYGPGTELAQILKWLLLYPRPGCPCKDHLVKMDRWGPDGCLLRLDRIVRWLRHEAAERHLPFNRRGARLMVVLAISRSRRQLARQTSELALNVVQGRK